MFNVLRAWLMPALFYLARLKDSMNQADQATKLNQIADAIATAKVNTAALKQEIADLQAAILVAGNSTPDIDAAFARIDAELSA